MNMHLHNEVIVVKKTTNHIQKRIVKEAMIKGVAINGIKMSPEVYVDYQRNKDEILKELGKFDRSNNKTF